MHYDQIDIRPMSTSVVCRTRWHDKSDANSELIVMSFFPHHENWLSSPVMERTAEAA
jgi:hypothetical protein